MIDLIRIKFYEFIWHRLRNTNTIHVHRVIRIKQIKTNF